jgi:hypothetical protein
MRGQLCEEMTMRGLPIGECLAIDIRRKQPDSDNEVGCLKAGMKVLEGKLE